MILPVQDLPHILIILIINVFLQHFFFISTFPFMLKIWFMSPNISMLFTTDDVLKDVFECYYYYGLIFR